MSPFIPVLLLLASSLVMLLVRWLRPHFSYFWLIAAGGALLAWGSLIGLWALSEPGITTELWKAENVFTRVISLTLDEVSWPYALAIVTLVLAMILTDVARATEADWTAWSGGLTLAAVGLIASLSGNLFTLLLAWATIDLAEVVLLLRLITTRRESERVVVAFSARALAYGVIVFAGVVGQSSGAAATPAASGGLAGTLLLLAAGLRLGVLPLHLPLLQEPPVRRGLGSVVRLVPVASSLTLLGRSDPSGLEPGFTLVLLALALFAGLYAAANWILAPDELDGRPFWVIGMASLALAAALQAQPAVSLAWGFALLLGGGWIFLYSARHRWLSFTLLGGVWIFSGLPYSPTWEATQLYDLPVPIFVFAFLLVQAGLMTGYARHALRPGGGLDSAERWVRLIYPLGLGLFPLAALLISWWPGKGLGAGSGLWWPGPAVLIVAGLAWFGLRRFSPLPRFELSLLRRIFSLDWVYRILWWFYQTLGRLIAFLNRILEGDGGVLWALLLLALMLSLVLQLDLGGGSDGF